MLHSAGLMMGYALPPFLLGQSAETAGGSDTTSTITSGSVSALPSGGSGIWDTVWVRQSGSSAIVPTAPGSLTTGFQATGMSVGTISAVFKGFVTDRVTGETNAITVTVTLTRGNPAMSVSTPADIFVQTPSSSQITVSGSTSITISGGVGPFQVTWSKSGDFSISPSGNSCGASRALNPTGGVQGTITATVLDQGTGQSTTRTANVTLINNGSAPPPLSVSVSPTSLDAYGDGINTAATTGGSATISASGAVGGVTYAWRRVSGSGVALSTSSQSTLFSCDNGAYGTFSGTFEGKATDSLGRSNAAVVSVTFYVPYIREPI